MSCQTGLEHCVEEFNRQPLYIPTKILALGSASCLKKAYFKLFIDVAPLSHTPLVVNPESQKIHDILAYIVPGFTYEYHSGNSDLERLVDWVWEGLEDVVETFSNINREDYRRLKAQILALIKGYAAVLDWLSKNSPMQPRDTYILTERMIINRPVGESHFLPTIGVPDVIVYNPHLRKGVIVDWKLHYRKGGNKLEYVQLAIYKHLLKKLTNGDIHAFLIYTTKERRDIKIISLDVAVTLSNEFRDVKVEARSIPNVIEQTSAVASFLYSLAFCRGSLRQIAKVAHECGVKVFNPAKRHRPCSYCLYREVCMYRFTPSEQLPQDVADTRRGFNKLYRIAISKKSEDHKVLVEQERCVEFDQARFVSPTVLLLEKRFDGVAGPFDRRVLRYALGRTTVYVFSRRDPLAGDFREIMSPLLFGRYDSDDVEKREEGGRLVLSVPVRMISPAFANRWLPLYAVYRYDPESPIFKDLRVCKGKVSLADIELKAIASIENALVRDRHLDSFIKKKLEELIRQAAYEYA